MNVLFVPDDGSSALPVLVGGEPENVDEVRAKEILSEGKFEIKIQLGIGEESAKYWTCDFSYVSLSFLSKPSLRGLAKRTLRRKSKPSTCDISFPSFHPFFFLSRFNRLYVILTLAGTELVRFFSVIPLRNM